VHLFDIIINRKSFWGKELNRFLEIDQIFKDSLKLKYFYLRILSQNDEEVSP
jgi:hypothetical protein